MGQTISVVKEVVNVKTRQSGVEGKESGRSQKEESG